MSLRRIMLSAVGILCSCITARAGPVSLGSFDFGSHAELPGGTRVGFALGILDFDDHPMFPDPPLGALRIGRGLQPTAFWDHGESGVLEFTPTTDPEFEAFASFVTDGIDEYLVVLWYWEDDGGYGGHGLLESQRFGLESDLVGSDLELIRLTVHEVSFEPLEEDLVSVHTRVTYDFLGAPIPEQGTIILLVCAPVINSIARYIR